MFANGNIAEEEACDQTDVTHLAAMVGTERPSNPLNKITHIYLSIADSSIPYHFETHTPY